MVSNWRQSKILKLTPLLFFAMLMIVISIGQAADDIISQPGQEIEGQDADTVGVIGGDDRTDPSDATIAPYIGIVHILFDGQGQCTGTVIAPRYVLTAASCVTESSSDTEGDNRITRADSVTVVAGRDGNDEPYGKFPVSQSNVYISSGWLAGDYNLPKADYAVLMLEAPLPGDANFFNLTEAAADNVTANAYRISGYPNTLNCNGTPCGGVQYEHSGLVNEYFDGLIEKPFSPPAGELRYQIDAAQNGQPGSPIFRNDSGTYRVVGIHSRYGGDGNLDDGQLYNQGAAITSGMLSELGSWGVPYNVADSTRIRQPSPGGLSSAINDANADAGNPWTIILSEGQTYNFTGSGTAIPSIAGNITIIGRGANITESSTGDIRFAQVSSGGKLTLTDDLTISGFNAGNTQEGAAVQVLGNAEFRAIGTVFSSNIALNGGALAVEAGSTALLENARFVGNTAFESGGAVFSDGGTVEVIDDAIGNEDENSATFASNSAKQGGAIRSQGGGALTLTGVHFFGNSAGGSQAAGRGGALSNTGTSTLTVQGSYFTDNSSSSQGGAIHHTSSSTANISNSILFRSVAGPRNADDITDTGEGAAVYAAGPTTMTDVEVLDSRTLRGDQDSALNDAFNGGAIDISADFTMQSSSPGSIGSYVQNNKIWLDYDLNQDKTDSDVVSEGAAFYVRGGSNITINDTCINGNLSQDIQGVLNESGTTVDATGNWWGSTDGPGGAGSGAGDRVSSNVNVSGFLTSQPSDCAESTLPPSNDDMIAALQDPFILELLDDSESFNNTNATVKPDPDEPKPSCGASNKTVWYTYEPLDSYDVSITVNPYGAVENAIPIVAVWTGDIADRENFAAVPGGCAVGTIDSSAQITDLSLTAGTRYWIQVGTSGSNGGNSQITLDAERTQLTAPLSGAILNTRRPTFKWDSVGYADSYTLNLTDGGNINETVVIPGGQASPCNATECSYLWGVRLPDGSYDWTVTVSDTETAQDLSSSPSQFSINSAQTENHIRNGDFSGGTTDFYTFTSNITAQVNSGVLEATGTSVGTNEQIIQNTGTDELSGFESYTPLAGTPFELTLDLGNNSTSVKDVTVRLVDTGGTGTPITCDFNVYQFAPTTYIVQGITDANWTGTNVEIAFVGDNDPALLVDNIDLRYRPDLSSLTGTVCEAPFNPDVNADGYITPVDAVYVINRIGNDPATGDNAPADVNGDTSINDSDVQIVLDVMGETDN